MPAGYTIFILVFYPFLFNLPLNLVRFQWGFKQGLAPMPPDVQKRAEAADRAVLLVMYLILLVTVVLLLNRSLISTYAVGLTTANWKSAMALGVLVSYVPVGLGALLQRFLAPDKPGEEPESHGPLAIWCGLTVLGALSVEFWRAFCIATLIRLELFPWVAVLVVAIAYGASQITTSTASAAGAATFGAAAGFLFVKTGSLLAPLTMSLIAAGAGLYRVRHLASRVLRTVVAVGYPGGSKIGKKPQNTGRNVICPSCKASFHPGKVKMTLTSFTCPDCGEILEYETETFAYILICFCLFGVPALLYYLGYRSLSLIPLSIAVAVVIFFLGIAIQSSISPSKAQVKSTYDGSGLRLTDKPKVRDDHKPTDD
jgi:predicted RNA-binding Zn-ribbon protein involved in translation (DUF1610 family)